MTTTSVNYGEISDGDVLNAGDIQFVYGTANNTIVNAGANQALVPSASMSTSHNTIVNTGGVQTLGGESYGTILNGGTQDCTYYIIPHGSPEYFGVAHETIINAGGIQFDRCLSYDSVINDGGTQNVSGSSYNAVINSGGLQKVSLDHNAINDGTTINAGGIMYVSEGTPTNVHLMDGGSIWLPEADPSSPAYVQFDAPNGLLTVHDGPSVSTIYLSGSYAPNGFTVQEVSDGSAKIVDSIRITGTPLCFCAGVRLATPNGERAVESLEVGELVLNADGVAYPVRWIGTTRMLLSTDNRPVVVKKDAFKAGVPSRDLRVTRGHSFLFNDVLVPIGELVNGLSIMWDAEARTVEVFHVALDHHDVLLAENAPAESFRDAGNLIAFTASKGDHMPTMSMPTFAPVVAHGPIVRRTRLRLMERAQAMAKHRANEETTSHRLCAATNR